MRSIRRGLCLLGLALAFVGGAANFYGQQRDEITRVETKLREGKVDIGALKVVEAPPATNPAPEKP